MKMKSTCKTLCGIICTALISLVTVNQTAADGTELLGTPSIPIADGSGVFIAGTGLHIDQPGYIEAAVPVDVSIAQVLLYWGGRSDKIGSEPGTNDTIMVNGHIIEGLRIGGPTPGSALYPSHAYRADITMVSADEDWLMPGQTNELTVEGLDFDYHDDGAAVVIVWDDGTVMDIEIVDGSDYAYLPKGYQTEAVDFGFLPAVTERIGYLNLIVTDLDAPRPAVLDIIVDGVTNRYDDALHDNEGDFLDVVMFDVPIPAGTSNVTAQILSVYDDSDLVPASLNWIFASWELAPPEIPGGGCTYTQGYWKNHPYDWPTDQLSLFTMHEAMLLLWSPPKGGNAYIILAHQYIAAELNMLNGASSPEVVQDAWEDARDLLSAYEDKGTIPKKSSDRDDAIDLASILDAYNNGEIGPGHCD